MADYNLGPYRPNPRGYYDSTESYHFLDMVHYDGSYYICKKDDREDGVSPVSGITPGEDNSNYWDIMAQKGDKGDDTNTYSEFLIVNNGVWNYTDGDKIYIPNNSTNNHINIINVYNGACGMIVTAKNLILPANSEFSKDFFYISASADEYYLYTFVYGNSGLSGENTFMWNRTVYNNGPN